MNFKVEKKKSLSNNKDRIMKPDFLHQVNMLKGCFSRRILFKVMHSINNLRQVKCLQKRKIKRNMKKLCRTQSFSKYISNN